MIGLGTHDCYYGMYSNTSGRKKWDADNHFCIRLTSDTDISASPWEYFLGFYRMYHVSAKRVEELIMYHLTPSFDDL